MQELNLELYNSYVLADDLWTWQKEHFNSFSDYKQWLKDNAEDTGQLEEERLYRVVQKAMGGLVEAAARGSAAGAAQLKSLAGLSNPVGRPRGSTNTTEEHKLNLMARDLQAYDEDVARLADN